MLNPRFLRFILPNRPLLNFLKNDNASLLSDSSLPFCISISDHYNISLFLRLKTYFCSNLRKKIYSPYSKHFKTLVLAFQNNHQCQKVKKQEKKLKLKKQELTLPLRQDLLSASSHGVKNT